MNKMELIGQLTLNYLKSTDAIITFRMNLYELYTPYMNHEITEEEFDEICKIDRQLCEAFKSAKTSRKHRVH